jgi:hypothetical protein
MPDPLMEVMRLIGAGIVGGLIASFATHRFTLSRERTSGIRNRRREFRAPSSFSSDQKQPTDFICLMRLLRSTRIRFRTCVTLPLPSSTISIATNAQNFDKLISIAGGFTGAQADGEKGKKRVIDSLDAILRFLDA